MKAKIPWNKGLTKEDPRVMRIAMARVGKHISEEHRRKIKGWAAIQKKPITIDMPDEKLRVKEVLDTIDNTIVKYNRLIYLSEMDYNILKRKIEFIMMDARCPICNQTDIIKQGHRISKHKNRQKYLCNNCKKTFTIGGRYYRMRHRPHIINIANLLSVNKYASRDISKIIKVLYGIDVTSTSILRWSKQYAKKDK